MPVEGDRPTVAKIHSIAVGQCICPVIRMADGASVVVSEPDRLSAVGADGGAGENQDKACIGECAVGTFAPGGLDRGVVMLGYAIAYLGKH